MNAILPTFSSFDDFLRWSQQQERGRFELEGGRIVAIPSENLDHSDTKFLACLALMSAIARSGLSLYAMPDGPSVRISENRAYQPDALVAPFPKPAGTSLEILNPIIVVEVLSPTSTNQRRDLSVKVEGYSRVASIQHYLIIDPEERQVLHYRREGKLLAPPATPSEGTLHLEPPGLELLVDDLLVPHSKS